MFAVSSGFLAALRSPSMTVVTKVVASDGTELAVESGSVTMDSRRNITRTCELDLLPTSTMSLQDVFDLVMQPDQELTVYRGLYVNGVGEYVPLGVFSTDTATMPKGVSGRVQWAGSDRAKKIARARFVDPYQIASATALSTATTQLLQSAWASTPTNFSNVSDTMSAGVIFEAGESSDPWASARELMADHAYDLNFDGYGIARAVALPDPSTQNAVFDFGSGDTNLVVGGDVSGTLEAVYNGVVATGEGTGVAAPVRSVVWDTDPNSPTYYNGGFGRSPYFYSSPLITTSAAAEAVATALLSKLKGRLSQLAWPAVVNPALEPLDVVTLTYDGVTSKVVIDALTIPLRAAEPMSAVAREVAIS